MESWMYWERLSRPAFASVLVGVIGLALLVVPPLWRRWRRHQSSFRV